MIDLIEQALLQQEKLGRKETTKLTPKGIEIMKTKEPDYWEKLMHQAAVTAMQGMWSNDYLIERMIQKAEVKEDVYRNITEKAIDCANILIEKLKKHEKGGVE